MFSSISNFMRHHDIDYADILMVLLVALLSVPLVTMAGYGIFAAITTFIGS